MSWAISRRLFLLGFVGVADPGSAIEKALGAIRWATVQASLFWNF